MVDRQARHLMQMTEVLDTMGKTPVDRTIALYEAFRRFFARVGRMSEKVYRQFSSRWVASSASLGRDNLFSSLGVSAGSVFKKIGSFLKSFGKSFRDVFRSSSAEVKEFSSDVDEAVRQSEKGIKSLFQRFSGWLEGVTDSESLHKWASLGALWQTAEVRESVESDVSSLFDTSRKARRLLGMTAKDWISFQGELYSGFQALNREYGYVFGLEEFNQALEDTLSLGMKDKKAIRDLTMELMVLREAFDNVDPSALSFLPKVIADSKDGPRVVRELADSIKSLTDMSAQVYESSSTLFQMTEKFHEAFSEIYGIGTPKYVAALKSAQAATAMLSDVFLDAETYMSDIYQAMVEPTDEIVRRFAMLGMGIFDVQKRLESGDVQGVVKEYVEGWGRLLSMIPDRYARKQFAEQFGFSGEQVVVLVKRYNELAAAAEKTGQALARSGGRMGEFLRKEDPKGPIEAFRNWLSSLGLVKVATEYLQSLEISPTKALVIMMGLKEAGLTAAARSLFGGIFKGVGKAFQAASGRTFLQFGKESVSLLGKALLNVGKSGVQTVTSKVAPFLGKAFQSVIPFASKAIAGIGPAISGALSGLGSMISGAFAAMAPILANPVTLAILGIAAAITGVILIVKNWGRISAWFSRTFPGIAEKIKPVTDFIGKAFKFLFGLAKAVYDKVVAFWGGVFKVVGKFLIPVFNFFASLGKLLSPVWQFFANVGKAVWDFAVKVWEASAPVRDFIASLATPFKWIGEVISWVWGKVEWLISKVSGVVNWFREKFGWFGGKDKVKLEVEGAEAPSMPKMPETPSSPPSSSPAASQVSGVSGWRWEVPAPVWESTYSPVPRTVQSPPVGIPGSLTTNLVEQGRLPQGSYVPQALVEQGLAQPGSQLENNVVVEQVEVPSEVPLEVPSEVKEVTVSEFGAKGAKFGEVMVGRLSLKDRVWDRFESLWKSVVGGSGEPLGAVSAISLSLSSFGQQVVKAVEKVAEKVPVLEKGVETVRQWVAPGTMTSYQTKFVNDIATGAIKGFQDYGVLPSISMAQAILESDWGRKHIDHNLFGMKWTEEAGQRGIEAVSRATTEYVGGKPVKTTALFRAYESFGESVEDHSRLLGTLSRYKGVIESPTYREAAAALVSGGYATDPKYAEKLIQIIERYQLQRFDEAVKAGKLVAPDFSVGQVNVPVSFVKSEVLTPLVQSVASTTLSLQPVAAGSHLGQQEASVRVAPVAEVTSPLRESLPVPRVDVEVGEDGSDKVVEAIHWAVTRLERYLQRPAQNAVRPRVTMETDPDVEDLLNFG